MEGALFLNSVNAQPVFEVGQVHHYSTLPVLFSLSLPGDAELGEELSIQG